MERWNSTTLDVQHPGHIDYAVAGKVDPAPVLRHIPMRLPDDRCSGHQVASATDEAEAR